MGLLKKQKEWVLWTGLTLTLVLLVGTLLMFDLIGLK
jgi:hypothetical protein